ETVDPGHRLGFDHWRGDDLQVGARVRGHHAPGQRWPSDSRSAPRATTRWPRVTPATSATRSSPSAAIWTGRRCTRPPSITNTAWPEPRPISAELGTDIAAAAWRTSISAVAVMPTFGTGVPGASPWAMTR